MKQIPPQEDFFEGAVSLQKGNGWIKPWRLPFGKLKLFPPEVEGDLVSKAENTAGVRLHFQTNASKLGLEIVPADEPRQFDLTIDGKLIATACVEAGEEKVVFEELPAGEKIVELWLPQSSVAALRCVLADEDAELKAVADDRPKWITYGSSITHCAEAHSPARTWPAIVARRRNLNLTCLGYGGQCHLDPMVALVIRDMPADFISLKVGINMHAGSLSPRTFKPNLIGFIQIVREKHPDIPIAVISPIISPQRETNLGTTGLALQMMRQEVEDAVSRLADNGDKNLHYFNGLELFGEGLVEDYLPDEVHPNADGYEILGENFLKVVMDKIPL